jgi:hypothetical protein
MTPTRRPRAAIRIAGRIAVALALAGLPAACSVPREAPGPAAESFAMPVAEVQAGLLRIGYDPGPVDGLIGPRTRSAVRAFQRANALAVSGRIDAPFAEALRRELARAGRDPAAVTAAAPPTAPAAPAPVVERSTLAPPTGAAAPAGRRPAAGMDAARPDAPERRPEARPAAGTAAAAPAAGTLDFRTSGHPAGLVARTGTPEEAVPSVRYALADLDGDGREDAVWSHTGDAYCAASGCSTEVLLAEPGGEWRPVARFLAFDVAAAPTATGGVRDLLVTGQRGEAIWRWTGSVYAPAGS